MVVRWMRTHKGSLIKCSRFLMRWVSLIKKGEAAYQLKEVSQVLYEQWKDEKPVIEGWITWESFKTTFLDRFFPLELR